MRMIFLLSVITFLSISNVSGQAAVPGYTDPAINRNKLIRDQLGEGVYKLIGPYKVIGTSYLFGEKRNGNIFSTAETAMNISINYDTYNQEVGFYSTSNPVTPLVKKPGEIDSFVIKQDIESGITSDLRFVYGPLLGASEKTYYQVIYGGSKFGLYKRYKAELGIVSTNYVQSELRQFDLVYDYFYVDFQTKKIKKLKWNIPSIIKEFKDIKDLTSVADKESFNANPEATAVLIFKYLNN